jgi:hypothetical protein
VNRIHLFYSHLRTLLFQRGISSTAFECDTSRDNVGTHHHQTKSASSNLSHNCLCPFHGRLYAIGTQGISFQVVSHMETNT